LLCRCVVRGEPEFPVAAGASGSGAGRPSLSGGDRKLAWRNETSSSTIEDELVTVAEGFFFLRITSGDFTGAGALNTFGRAPPWGVDAGGVPTGLTRSSPDACDNVELATDSTDCVREPTLLVVGAAGVITSATVVTAGLSSTGAGVVFFTISGVLIVSAVAARTSVRLST